RSSSAPSSRDRCPPRYLVSQPLSEHRPELLVLAGQLDHRLQVAEWGTGVVAHPAVDDPVHRGAFGQHQRHRVGELDLPAAAGWGTTDRIEDPRRQYVPADDG